MNHANLGKTALRQLISKTFPYLFPKITLSAPPSNPELHVHQNPQEENHTTTIYSSFECTASCI